MTLHPWEDFKGKTAWPNLFKGSCPRCGAFLDSFGRAFRHIGGPIEMAEEDCDLELIRKVLIE